MSKIYKYIFLLVLLFLYISIYGSNDRARENIITTAKKYLDVKYNYGGINSSGFDCSGFVSYVYKCNGINLPRSAKAQYKQGKKISLEKAEQGDLVFFKIYRNKISHVGIYLGNSMFIHAPSSGKKVSITDMNISYWKKRFAGAATYL